MTLSCPPLQSELVLPIETKGPRVCEDLPGIFKYFFDTGVPSSLVPVVLAIETKSPHVCEGLPGIFNYFFDAGVPTPLVPV
jgi:hypothetical protein